MGLKMPPDCAVTDVSMLDIENIDIDLVSETQIVEFISRNELGLSRLVNEVLIASGYRTLVSPFGKDGSVEILADGKIGPLGFVLPRIAVLVRPDIDLASPALTELEEFVALTGAANALFVSWTGFTDLAKKEAGRLFHQTKFWDVSKIVEMLRVSYDHLSDSLKSDLRLTMVLVLARCS